MSVKLAKFKEIYKKWEKRVIVWLVGLVILLLVDEYIKEGYLFKLSDILCLGSHENIIMILITVLIIINVVKKKK